MPGSMQLSENARKEDFVRVILSSVAQEQGCINGG
jgi:hypothetical protein